MRAELPDSNPHTRTANSYAGATNVNAGATHSNAGATHTYAGSPNSDTSSVYTHIYGWQLGSAFH